MIPNTGNMVGRTFFITGASRGIGKAIALKAARDGANIVIAAKTTEPHPKLPGTIYTAAKEIESAGGKALPCIVDVRDEVSINNAINETIKTFGGLDVVVNNASAISLTDTQVTSMKKYDLMHQINTRGTFLVSKLSIPHLSKSKNPHILNISPPLNMKPRWFKDHVSYTMAKYGMSMCVLGMAEELKPLGIACNALWPRTAIMTAAMEMLGGQDISKQCRKPEIMADAAYVLLGKDSKSFTGNFVIDDEILKEVGITDFSEYAVDKSCTSLLPDFFLDEFDQAAFPNLSKGAVESSTSKQSDGSPLAQIFAKIGPMMDAPMVEKIQSVYVFEVTGDEKGRWYLDLKAGSGAWGQGDPPTPADATLTMKGKDLIKMFQGGLKPTTAFMMGKLKIAGDMSKALKLEKIMTQLQSKL